MARPGIMLYFDILEPIRVLSDADKGRLLVAILEYGQTGKVPVFEGMLALAWGFVKPKIDRDSEEYNRTVLKRQYATFCRDRKKKDEPEISFEEWMMTIDNQSYQMISHDVKWYPTTTSTAAVTPAATGTITPSTTTKSTGTSTAAVAANETANADGDITAAAAEKKLKYFQGELGQGVVLLSDEQVESLLGVLDLDGFDHYVSKLANFIIKNDAKVKNHYETILKWWKEDSNAY